MEKVTVKLIENGKAQAITCGDLSWSESEDSLGAEFNFSCPFSPYDPEYNKLLKVGSIVAIYYGSSEVLRGIITAANFDGSYSGYDFCWYLNKSEEILQLKKVAADKAIKDLLKKYNVAAGNIPVMSTSITKLYKDEIVSDIIRDILKKVKQETGKGYRLEMNQGKLDIVEKGSKHIEPTYTDDMGSRKKITETAEINGSRSIENLVNRVIVAGSDDKKKQIKATAEDSTSIAKYGLITQVETEDDINEAKARNKAKNILKELDKVTVEFTADMMGSMDVKPCRRLYFENKAYGLKGWYKVVSCSHSISGGIYRVSAEMEA